MLGRNGYHYPETLCHQSEFGAGGGDTIWRSWSSDRFCASKNPSAALTSGCTNPSQNTARSTGAADNTISSVRSL